MKNLRKSLYALFITFTIFSAHFAFAGLEITEIMYDPKGANANHQWIEVYNSDANDILIDTSKWRFSDGSLHYLNDKVNFTVLGQSYFILTGDKNTFLAKYPDFSGLVVDTVMSLDKDSGTVSLVKDGSVINSVSYNSSLGASEDDNTLQYISGSWVPAVPTLGNANHSSDTLNNETNNNIQNTTSTATSPKVKIIPKLTAEIVSSNVANTGIDLPMNARVQYGDQTFLVGKIVWNFGDGSTKIQNAFEPFTHKYTREGEYVVTLSYFEKKEGVAPASAKDRMIISVVAPGVAIDSLGSYDDAYISLYNNSKYEIDLSNWVLKGGDISFTIPEGTVILPSKKLIFDSSISNIKYSTDTVLLKPSGVLASKYGGKLNEKVVANVAYKARVTETSNTNNEEAVDLSKAIDNTASAKNGGVSVPNEILLVLLLIGIGITTSYFFLRKKSDETLFDQNDFKIIE